jgi:hypothetical protein
MDDAEHVETKLEPTDPDQWNKQMYRVRVFDELVYDNDPNLTNVLIGEDWTVWRIDFSRAFRKSKDLQVPKNPERCDRQLLDEPKELRADELAEKTERYLTKNEVNGVIARRDKIVAAFQILISENVKKESSANPALGCARAPFDNRNRVLTTRAWSAASDKSRLH